MRNFDSFFKKLNKINGKSILNDKIQKLSNICQCKHRLPYFIHLLLSFSTFFFQKINQNVVRNKSVGFISFHILVCLFKMFNVTHFSLKSLLNTLIMQRNSSFAARIGPLRNCYDFWIANKGIKKNIQIFNKIVIHAGWI